MFFNLEKQVKKYKIKTNELAYVGANLGQNINEFKSLFNNPVIHLFEPQKHVFNNLKKSYSNDNSLRFYNFALGSKASNVEMHINTNNFNQSSSILKPTGTIDYHRGILFAGTETIEVKKFSDLINLSCPILIGNIFKLSNLRFDCNISRDGISSLHGKHQVAQKFNTRIFPL